MNKLKQKILKYLRKIPNGKVTTYGAIAKRFKTSPRAVGRIMGSNPWPDKYPCYKVIMSNGSLGGFGLGIKDKIRRLKGDGINIKNNRIEPENIVF